jgi:hypothetical protein
MTRWSRWSCAGCYIVAGLLVMSPHARAQTNPLGAARDLYAAAAYDEALGALNNLRSSSRREDLGVIEQYRAFCLLALGRSAEADAAIEAAVAAAPFAQPSDSDCSPRVRAAFRDVRRRVLPGVIEREYTDAKAAFDRKDPGAADRFTRVLALIADPDLKGVENVATLSRLRTLANDFLVLSTPKAPPAPPVPLPAQQVATPLPIASPLPDPTRVYAPADADVLPPFPVYQSFEPMKDIFALRPGVVEVVIDELGKVVFASTKISVNPVYDRFAISTAKTWKYRPAVRNGVAVKYRLLVQIPLQRKY